MAKKKKYVPKTDEDWNEQEARDHRKTIRAKEKAIIKKYKQWWDPKKGDWKEGFDGH